MGSSILTSILHDTHAQVGMHHPSSPINTRSRKILAHLAAVVGGQAAEQRSYQWGLAHPGDIPMQNHSSFLTNNEYA